MSKEIWEEKYRAARTGWDRGAPGPALLHWLDAGVLSPCRVLVPACGYGHEVVALAARGFGVTALEIAPTPVAALRRRLADSGLEAEVIEADMLAWEADRPFDAVYEQTALCALDPSLWRRYESRLHAWLRPGGRLFALFMQTGREGGPPFHCGLETMHKLFTEERWNWPAGEPGRVAHRNGLYEYALVLQRR